jgi:hypothetical protein
LAASFLGLATCFRFCGCPEIDLAGADIDQTQPFAGGAVDLEENAEGATPERAVGLGGQAMVAATDQAVSLEAGLQVIPSGSKRKYSSTPSFA